MGRTRRTLTGPILRQKRRSVNKLQTVLRRAAEDIRIRFEGIIRNNYRDIMEGKVEKSYANMEYILNLFLNIEATNLERTHGNCIPVLQSKVTKLNHPYLLSINNSGRILYAGYDLLTTEITHLQQIDFVVATRSLVHNELLHDSGTPLHRYPKCMKYRYDLGALMAAGSQVWVPQVANYRFTSLDDGWTISIDGLIDSLADTIQGSG